MIGIIFQFAAETMEVRVDRESVYFRTPQSPGFTTINGLKLDKAGVLKEFPELKDNPKWQSIARERFKEKIKECENEMERVDYIISDLKKYGYKPLYLQRQGFRVQKLQ